MTLSPNFLYCTEINKLHPHTPHKNVPETVLININNIPSPLPNSIPSFQKPINPAVPFNSITHIHRPASDVQVFCLPTLGDLWAKLQGNFRSIEFSTVQFFTAPCSESQFARFIMNWTWQFVLQCTHNKGSLHFNTLSTPVHTYQQVYPFFVRYIIAFLENTITYTIKNFKK